jgi:O-antigen/teichoic acid export membrane protein
MGGRYNHGLRSAATIGRRSRVRDLDGGRLPGYRLGSRCVGAALRVALDRPAIPSWPRHRQVSTRQPDIPPERIGGRERKLDGHSDDGLSGSEVKKRAASGVISITLRTLGTRVLGGLGTLVLARLLTPHEFGDIAFGLALVAFGSLFADGGMATALLRRKEEPTRDELRAMLGFHLALATISAIVIAAIGLPLGQAGRLAAIMALALPLDALRVPPSIVVERRLRYGVFVWPQVIEIVAWNVVAVVLVAVGLGVWGVAIAAPVRALVGSIAMISMSPVSWLRPRLSLRIVQPFLRFGFTFQASNVVALLRDQGLYVMTAAISGLATLGVWSLTTSVVSTATVGYSSLWQVALPGMSRLLDAGEAIKPVIERSLRIMIAATGFLCVALAGTAPAAVPVLLGARWHAVVPLLAYASGAILVGAAIAPVAIGYFYATNRPGIPLRVTIAHTLVLFAVTIPILSALGSEALGIGGCAAGVTDGVLLGWALSREGVKVLDSCAVPMALAVGAGTVGWFVAKAITEPVVALFASGLAAEALYLAALIVMRRQTVLEMMRVLQRYMLTRSAIRGAVAP